MRVLFFALAVPLAVAPARAETITPSEAKNHVGQNLTVEGAVAEVHHTASGKAIFIDVGGRYPNNTFAGVIFSDDFNKFPNVDSLEGKTVDITGTVKLYRNRPEIILNDVGQLKAK